MHLRRQFARRVRQEWASLRAGLPPTIWVRAYEARHALHPGTGSPHTRTLLNLDAFGVKDVMQTVLNPATAVRRSSVAFQIPKLETA